MFSKPFFNKSLGCFYCSIYVCVCACVCVCLRVCVCVCAFVIQGLGAPVPDIFATQSDSLQLFLRGVHSNTYKSNNYWKSLFDSDAELIITKLFCFNCIVQWFPTRVPWHTRMPWISAMGAASYCTSMKFWPIFYLGVSPNTEITH